MKPKPLKTKGFWNNIKELIRNGREYEMVSNLDWNSEDGMIIDNMLFAYHQLVAEEDKRVADEMNKKSGNKNDD